MWIKLLPVAFALTGAMIAVFTDLRNRIIPNELTYSMTVFGIIFSIGYGIFSGDLLKASYGFIGAGLGFGVGYLMYLTGGWAGGDVKLFMGMGALLPSYSDVFGLSYDLILPEFVVGYPLFPLTILVNSVIAAAPVILFYLIVSKVAGFSAIYDEVKISEVEEGMIPGEIIYEFEEEIHRKDAGYLGFLRKLFENIPDGAEVFTNPDRAAGVTEEQIEKLQGLVEADRLEDCLRIKKGMPFAPSLAAGLFISVFFGSLYWTMVTAFV